jgi:hypothetical protein
MVTSSKMTHPTTVPMITPSKCVVDEEFSVFTDCAVAANELPWNVTASGVCCSCAFKRSRTPLEVTKISITRLVDVDELTALEMMDSGSRLYGLAANTKRTCFRKSSLS